MKGCYKLDDITQRMSKRLQRKLENAEKFISGRDITEDPFEQKPRKSFLEFSLSELKVYLK